MKVIIAGSSGLVGRELKSVLEQEGHQVIPLLRKQVKGAAFWDPAAGILDKEILEGADAIVNLSGENIAGRWTEKKKKKILESRLQGTALISKTLAQVENPPKVWVNASAIGYYGSCGSEELTEKSGKGSGFLAEVCQQWEEAAQAPKSTRLVILRIGVVLTPKGGALKRMLPPFKLGLGGKVGDGRQVMSWITLEDLVQAIIFSLTTPSLQGPVNAVAPHPVTNAELTYALGRALNRPTLLPLPAFAVRLLLGEMGEALLLSSSIVIPQALLDAGYHFSHPRIELSLRPKSTF